LTDTQATGLPTGRTCPFDPSPELSRSREKAPLTRMTYPDGHEGWLATGHQVARTVLADSRFSARHELRHSPIPVPGQPSPAMPGIFIGMDEPDHSRYRQLLNRHFTARRVHDLEPMIERITERCLDAMASRGTQADLVTAFALPLPALVICELLGAPEESHDEIQRHRMAMIAPDPDPTAMREAVGATMMFLMKLAARRRTDPSDDLLSGLLADGELTDQELSGIAMLMLIAGHETTASMLSMSVYLLLERPELAAALRGLDGELVPGAADELLRYLSVVQFASRAALTDIELDGQLVKEGETVTISLSTADRDGARFPDPDTFDVDRPSSGHVAFGHGAHQCIGQHLARAEMRIALSALLRRFPDLRLAVPADDVVFRGDSPTIGLQSLPVAW
jgi:cytochrome P450